MSDKFKESPYWGLFADVVSFMRENYPVIITEEEYPDRVVQSYERYCEKYRGSQLERMFCNMACYVLFELQKIYYEGHIKQKEDGSAG